ncbi:MAG: DMT family transporter [Minisyncoccia bacterium]
MTWALFLAASILAQAIANVMNRVVMKSADKGTWAYSALSQIITGSLVGIYALINGFQMPPLLELWPFFLMTTILNIGQNVFQNEALRTAEISFFTILSSTRILISMFAAFLVLGEHVTLAQGFGAIVMIAAVTVAFSRRFEWKWEPWMGYAFLYALCSGLVFIGDAKIVSQSPDVISYVALAFLVPGFATIAIKPWIAPDVFRLAASKQVIQMTAWSASYGFMAVTLWLAYYYGATASAMAPIRQSAVILTVIIAMIFLNERTHMLRKTIAALLAILAVYLISV